MSKNAYYSEIHLKNPKYFVKNVDLVLITFSNPHVQLGH